jgi:superfamily II DNA or RNA helicase/very-short-patch-repair endonuclease
MQGLTPTVDRRSLPEAKIALFRSLFRGREDVYPRRFESMRTGKSGYAPACANEWVRGGCQKPDVRCADCPNRRFLPVSDEVVRQHLVGVDDLGRNFVLGVYPLLLDETAWLLAMDFDKAAWREDVSAVRETCDRCGLPCAVERSRSGNGAHLWLFFEEALPAALVRKLGAALLTRTMEQRPEVGLDSYDRFFPNQDTLPKGGFGNLIALPLQQAARIHGNTVFLDYTLEPFADAWAFLSELQRIPRPDVEQIVRDEEARCGNTVGVSLALSDDPCDDDDPWTAPPSRRHKEPPWTGPLPTKVELVLGDGIHIAREGLPPALRNRLLRLAAFQNPEFYAAQARRMPTFGIPRVIACAEDCPHHVHLPRGCLEDVQRLLADLGVAYSLRDERQGGTPLSVAFHGELRLEQRAAATVLEAHECGVLAATTAFGKTVVAAWLVARRGVNTLVLVHRQQLLEQWVSRLASFLELPAKEIGRIGGGRRRPTGRLDVALIQSLVRKGAVDNSVADYGQLIVDECHRLPAVSFEQVARRARARYVLGLSATPTRKDGHHPILFMQCGSVRYRVDARQQAGARPFIHTVRVCPTAFRTTAETTPDLRAQFQALYEELVRDPLRNELIARDVLEAVRDGRNPIVLTERTAHLQALEALLAPSVRNLVILRGGMGRRQLRETLSRLAAVPDTETRVVLATGRYIGEGFDDARLDTLFLTLPISWRGTIAQYAGRLHRLHDGKREVRIHDYADLNVPMLARMFDRRCRGYEAIGYSILLPASAVPGWPPEVPLPVEPEWKREYAASVQRLIRDGVDAHLGNLFVHAARIARPDADDACPARSATEAFLFRRLETLPETAGRFRLNGKLPIPFDLSSQMEVDLLCTDARVAVELDGAQHLSDADAYRRDRRKDALLQENGFLVLRFLAEDVGKRLDPVLDTVLRTLAHQAKALARRPPAP